MPGVEGGIVGHTVVVHRVVVELIAVVDHAVAIAVGNTFQRGVAAKIVGRDNTVDVLPQDGKVDVGVEVAVLVVHIDIPEHLRVAVFIIWRGGVVEGVGGVVGVERLDVSGRVLVTIDATIVVSRGVGTDAGVDGKVVVVAVVGLPAEDIDGVVLQTAQAAHLVQRERAGAEGRRGAVLIDQTVGEGDGGVVGNSLRHHQQVVAQRQRLALGDSAVRLRREGIDRGVINGPGADSRVLVVDARLRVAALALQAGDVEIDDLVGSHTAVVELILHLEVEVDVRQQVVEDHVHRVDGSRLVLLGNHHVHLVVLGVGNGEVGHRETLGVGIEGVGRALRVDAVELVHGAGVPVLHVGVGPLAVGLLGNDGVVENLIGRQRAVGAELIAIDAHRLAHLKACATGARTFRSTRGVVGECIAELNTIGILALVVHQDFIFRAAGQSNGSCNKNQCNIRFLHRFM